ncbi:acyltransferase ChoActase/COT/CPT [Blyttiomyces helicus]|uniref:Carnitine O-acetyltransferase, mitochondrial n=1 Tax=Blyttiomyces helicus TaxID=388810 RepID=A0A4V1IR04_9FUNG|nr:acyltransferase ChoActase/COT/CPT [Blyttiomyces helicus]|eukprot:RKO88367.1 acyltransferase ChoActase/COT/CPT [Blyttiomyces helicus]
MPLYKHQSALPALPVPTLEETLPTYLRSVRPLVDDAAFAKTKKAVEDFVKPGSLGLELQKRLVAHKEASKTSWLIDWWNDYAYMAYRDPVVINVNYFFVFKDDKRRRLPAARAASIITGALEFKNLVVSEELTPDMARNSALCSHQYRFMFNSTRIPKIPSDVTRGADSKTNTHIVVLRHNQFFTFDSVHPDGRQLSAAEIEAQIQRIYETAGNSKETPVGLLTTENRDVWTKAREDLLAASPVNQKSLDAIETALFAVCLDDFSPVTREEASRACWHGDGRNRFFDKSLQFIIFENGKAGFNGEHSMMDATPTSRMCDWIVESITKDTLNYGPATVAPALPAPTKLNFNLTPALESTIAEAGKKFDAVIDAHDVRVVAFEAYGKKAIKKFGVSPDAYAQMAIQLAYYKMYGVCRPTYESAQTKKYAYGRTETCRSVSVESVEWVKAMEDTSVPLKVKGELGRKACQSQSSYMAKCIDARGVDRHLLGLRLVLKPDEPKPSLFTDPTFSYSCHWNLSTSQIPSENYEGYGWGEVVPDGYGIAYMVKENSLQFNLASLKLNNHHFQAYFHEALHEMKLAFEAAPPPPKAKL